DGLDGRMARLLKTTSNFGAELDSLADFVSFGVAPATVLYLWTMSELHVLGWVIVLFFAVCCALRLARFNAETNAAVPAYATPFLTTAPWPTLMIVGVVYLGSIPLTIRSYYRLKHATEARKAEMAERPGAIPLPGPAALPLGEATAPRAEWRH